MDKSERDRELAVLDAAHRYWLATNRFFASEKEYRRADREAPNAIVMGRAYAAFELDRGSVLHAATDLLEAVREWGGE